MALSVDSTTAALLDQFYDQFDGCDDMEEYARRHKIDSLDVLTVYDDKTASEVAAFLQPRIKDKVVVEIGAGIGLLACHLAIYAKHVYAIEANPIWASCFAVALLKQKPINCTYILGAASEMNGLLRADVALFCTHSGAASMRASGLLFAGEVIDVYKDLMGDKIDSFADAIRQADVEDVDDAIVAFCRAEITNTGQSREASSVLGRTANHATPLIPEGKT